ncbi:MAG: adenylyltransferase/cytidyltransferase family protein, partial [Candidatus Hodarchaeales archaeon]
MRALFLGRFNPFHLGHLAAIEYIRKDKDVQEVVIGIGSSDKSFSLIHPFSAGE